MENYVFEPNGVVIHWYTKLHARLAAFHDKHVLYKQFTSDQHLDKLESENIGYHLPKSYPIVTNEIERLYQIRDKILIKHHHNDFKERQTAIDNRLKELENEHELLKNRRVAEKESLDELKAKKRSEKDPNNIIALESRISKAMTTLNNTDAAIKHCENQTSALVHAKKDNLDNWGKQVAMIEKTIEMEIGNYIKKATARNESAYGFTEFTHFVGKYDEEMQKIIKGEY
jgi:hypothetical protein